jgi:hypothetical protein
MARPRKDDIEKRTVQVNIRLTKEEAEKVKEFATGSGLSPANWIREKVFTGRFPSPKISPLDAAIYQELKKVDVNLNQAVHKLNIGEKPDGIFLKLLFELRALLNRIYKLLLHDRQPDQG